LAPEIVFWILRSTLEVDELIGLLESYGDQRALEMRRAAERLADDLGAPLIAAAIQRLAVREPAAESVLAPAP
jgi:hypothetical protein